MSNWAVKDLIKKIFQHKRDYNNRRKNKNKEQRQYQHQQEQQEQHQHHQNQQEKHQQEQHQYRYEDSGKYLFKLLYFIIITVRT